MYVSVQLYTYDVPIPAIVLKSARSSSTFSAQQHILVPRYDGGRYDRLCR